MIVIDGINFHTLYIFLGAEITCLTLSHPQLLSTMIENTEITVTYLNIFQVYKEGIIEGPSS